MVDKPKTIYLDQNIYGQMLDANPGDWRQGELAKILLEARDAETGLVWAGPTNVIETAQASEAARRKALAAMMLELIDARRMWWGHEFEAVQDFYNFLRTFCPTAIRYDTYLQHHGTNSRQVWLGALGLLAVRAELNDTEVIPSLLKTKAVNRLLHARFATNPDDWIDRMVAATSDLTTTTDDVFSSLDAMTPKQIENEIESLSANACKIGKAALKTLNENRDAISRAYGAMEVGLIMRSICVLPMEIELTFNIPDIVASWPTMQRATKCDPLPEDIRTATHEQLTADSKLVADVLRLCIRAAARRGLMTGYLGFQVLLRELQQCMNDKVVPTGGLTFDADHAAALTRHQIFVCRDMKFSENLKTLAKKVHNMTGGHWSVQVVSSATQLRKALKQ